MELPSREVDRCRICGSKRLHRYLDMGRTPLANSYLEAKDAGKPEFSEELCLQLCEDCGLSQLTQVVHPDRMFRHYLYVSSTTATMRDHFAEFALSAAKAAGAGKGDLAIDVASNDGCLLKAFRAAGMEILGVDPAENLAKEANANGLRTECAYWSKSVAKAAAKKHGRAKVITAANVFAHADDLHGFMEGVAEALDKDGVFAIECPYALEFVKKREFDTAYHEHLSYIGLTPLAVLADKHGFEIFDVEFFPEIHGGTIRTYIDRKGARPVAARAKAMLAEEAKFGIKDRAVYDEFARGVLANRDALRSLVGELNARKETVWAYGASAKGNTLMNFFGLTSKEIPCAIDDNPKKWGLLAPGSHMRIVGIDALKKEKVDCLLLLAWNFEKEIAARCRAAGWAGKLLLPVPKARLRELGAAASR